MPLTEAGLAEELKRAMKGREETTVSVLRGVVAAAKYLKDKRRVAELGEDDLIGVVRQELRKREEAIDFARKAGRDDLVERNEAERSILAGYVPSGPTGAMLEAKVRELADVQRDLGAIMRALKAEYGAALDGRAASEVARRVLAETSEAS